MPARSQELPKVSVGLVFFLNLTAWLLAGLGPVLVVLRVSRDVAGLGYVALVIAGQVLFGVYTWRMGAAYELGKIEWMKSAR